MRLHSVLVPLALIAYAGSVDPATAATAQPAGERFVAIAFHDVVDDAGDAGWDAVTTAKLVQFFEWVKRAGWTAVSLDDLSAAARGARPLPPRAILITFDDGYRSLYTRVYPLLKAYRFPAVAALVGSWLEPRSDGTVLYGDQSVPRDRFVSWDNAREMQDSGLVEFASHSYDLHRGMTANPQGSTVPAAIASSYDPATHAYEDDAQYRERIRVDLTRARRLMATHLGRSPRALVWPYGRYSGPALDVAKQAGFTFALTLEPEPASTSDLYAIHRYFPTRNPSLGEIVQDLEFEPHDPPARRIVCLGLDGLAAISGPAAQDDALGALIERLRALGADTVVLDAHAALPASDAPLGDVYFPTPQRPIRADLLSRVAWQVRTRAGSEVYLHLPVDSAAAAVGEPSVPGLFADLARHVPSDGIAIEMSPPAGTPVAGNLPGDVRARRAALDLTALDPESRRGLEAYRSAAAIDPRLRLMIFLRDPAGPPDWADIGLLPPQKGASQTGALARRLRADGWLRSDASRRIAFSLPSDRGSQVGAIREAQRAGASAIALCPGQPLLPASPDLAAAFSAAVYPYKP